MTQVKFLTNWNNKLNNKYFLTIRLLTKSKKQFYTNQLLNYDDVNVLVEDVLYCKAKLVCLDIEVFKNLPKWLCYVDSGLNKEKFYELLETIYKNKKEWKGKNTKVIILCYKRIDIY